MSEAASTRHVVFDTETTGLDRNSDRVVEIAAVEIDDLMPTGRKWHAYINPMRDVPEEARRVHGLTREFLADKPRFSQVAHAFLEFAGDAPLVAHNAPFDFGMINAELSRMGLPPLSNRMIDTVPLARRRFPGGKVTLDDLCRKFGIDLSRRKRHEAMLDTELLAEVYLQLNGGRHRILDFGAGSESMPSGPAVLAFRPFRPSRGLGGPSDAELSRHAAFLAGLKSPIWADVALAPQLSSGGLRPGA